jgi:sugar phosphate isomerase/epimerase
MPDMTIGLQLYTVRDLVAKDMAVTLKKVAEVGYRNVELAGFGNLKTAKAVKQALDSAGVKAVSGHWAINVLEKDVERIMEEAQMFDLKHVVVPYLPDDRRKDAEVWKATAHKLDEIGSFFHGIGVELCYHNHNFEFQKYDGKTGLEILFENTTAHLVKFEIDVYWVKNAGEDPVKFIDKLGERVRLLHLKDMLAGPEKKFAPVGAGTLDFKAILASAEKNGVRFGIVEQDNCYDTPPLEAIKTSLESLKKLGAA